MLGHARFDRFHIGLLQNGFAATFRAGLQTCDAVSLIPMQLVVDHDFTAAHDLCHLLRSAALAFEQNHLAASTKNWTAPLTIALFQRLNFNGTQLDSLDPSHKAKFNLFV